MKREERAAIIIMKKRTLKNMNLSNRVFYLLNSIFWIIIMGVILYPLYLVFIASVSDPNAIVKGKVIWKPVDFSLVGYKHVFEYSELWTSYGNSLMYTAVSVCISIVVTLSAAYVLSRRNFPGKKALNLYFVIPMFFSGGLIPTFLTMHNIGLYNTRWILILIGCVSVWNLMVARTYIQSSIPEELYEAAVLDGCSHLQFFTKVVLPLSKTIIAVLAVYYGVSKWNDYFSGLIYIRDREKLPLQTVLREIVATLQVDRSGEFMMSIDESVADIAEALRVASVSKYCIIVISTAPVIILYALLQKYFEKGVMIGSLKG